jgi:preprotein translocase subunit SecA
MLRKIVNILGGDPHKKEVDRLSKIVDQINALEADYEKLSDAELRAKSVEFRKRLDEGETLDDLLPEGFAAVREASKRKNGQRPYDVQMVGGITLHSGKIAEMRTGEGKTLVATLPVCLNAITGRGVHVVTVNDYLARRDARWMAPIYNALGLTVGVLQMAARTENGQNAFLVDLDKTSPHEDQNQLRMVSRNEAYLADITYGTNSEFGFDYLRDNLTNRLEDRVQRGHYFSVVDEVDNILIDEARTPLIISGPAQDDSEWYVKMSAAVRQLRPEDYEVSEKDRAVNLTELGEVHVEELLGMTLRDPERPEDITPEQARLMGYLEQALRAQHLYRRNKDYLVQASKVVIIDEFTGRLMPGRRWSDGLHQAVEAKEGVKVEPENVTYATITIQNYFRMYEKLAGMSGTALTEAEEFYKIYKLDVLPIPTNLEYVALRADAPYVQVETKDPQGYKFTYYMRKGDAERSPVYWKRKDFPDVVFRTEEAKLRAITIEILHYHVMGRPQLVGTTSVEHSERLSRRLGSELLRKLIQVQLIRDIWLERNKVEIIERAIPELAPLNKNLAELDTADIRQLARALDITLSFNVEDPENLARLRRIVDTSPEGDARLIKALQGGVPHEVLNARKHDEESKIIAKAGAFGAVTIATNMAGRGVDIKLGGDLDEEILGDTNRVLERAGYDAYNMNNVERRDALFKLNEDDFGIYGEQVKAFLQYMDEMKKVRELGGLHVVGSERHEARRIDNQLRGRAARQGDPGSSRFYLALDDELMRLFGGQQVEGLMARMKIDESVPIESGLVGRLVEQSQERVEGSNFDVRKHLLEYDDVLNAQRKRIYQQRDRVFTKEDLTEDVSEMLTTELQNRIPRELKAEEGPWKLLAFLEDVQPPIAWENLRYPSFSMRLLVNEIERRKPEQGATSAHLRSLLLDLAARAFRAERDHILKSFNELLDKTQETMETQRQERMETLDSFIEGIEDVGENGAPRRPQELTDELTVIVRLPNFRVSSEQLRWMKEDPDQLKESIGKQIDTYMLNLNVTRMAGAIERRVGESLNLKPGQFSGMEWAEIADGLSDEASALLDRQYERLLGENGQIVRDLDTALEKVDEYSSDSTLLLDLLQMMSLGVQRVFDRKTHRQGYQQTTRLRWVYLAAQLLGEGKPQEITDQVLEHLEGAQDVLTEIYGKVDAMVLQQNRVTLRQSEPRVQESYKDALGAEVFEAVADCTLDEFTADQRETVEGVLGWWRQNDIYRQLLLSVISELWVEYLTKVEALRVSIGLEAYAQRDPLVQYKSQASEMFSGLLVEIRTGVIGRMFNYRPRPAAPTPGQAVVVPAQAGNGSAAPRGNDGHQPQTPAAPAGQDGDKKKRRRH